jgi:hypothetical protein
VRPSAKKPRIVSAPYQCAETALGTLEPGCRVIGLTKGQFSLLDILRAVLAQTGPAHVVVSTWTTGIRDAQNARMLLDAGKILSFRLLTDRSFATRQPKYAAEVRRLFGVDSIRATNTHAKFLLVRNKRWNIAVRSSMNLNRNPRFEQFDLDNDSEIADFLEAHAAEMANLMPEGDRPTAAQTAAGFAQSLGGGVASFDGYDATEGPEADDGAFDMTEIAGLT